MSKSNKKQQFNIFAILMAGFLIYIIFIIISFVSKDKIYSYEVRSGSLAKINTYKGIALREEKLIPCISSGYISYFAREGEHVGVSDYVYSIDQSGSLDEIVYSKAAGDNNLNDDDLREIKDEIVNFCNVYNDHNFSRTYDFKYTMEGVVLKHANQNILNEINKGASSDFVKMGRAEETGYVVYSTDGMESTSVNDIDASLFDNPEYEKTQLVGNSLIDEGGTAYKLITSDNWQLVIPLTDDRAEEFKDVSYINVRFMKDRRELKAALEIKQVLDDYYGILSFNSSVASYCTDRFLEIEIITEEQQGLKIPLSSLVYKEFYLIPKSYALDEGEDGSYYFLRKTFLEDGTVSSERVCLKIYAEIDDKFYIDDKALKMGDYILPNDSVLNEYPVAEKGELVGVYNMNLAYADFRQVSILYQNEEYAIVDSKQMYGLKEYDFIVLDSSAVKEDAILYE